MVWALKHVVRHNWIVTCWSRSHGVVDAADDDDDEDGSGLLMVINGY